MSGVSEFTDGTGLVSPSTWPVRSHELGLDWVEEMADEARRLGDRVTEVTGQVVQVWSGMRQQYQGPGEEKLWAAMAPVGSDGEAEKQEFGSAHRVMAEYAQDVSSLKRRLADVETEATLWRGRVASGIWVSGEDLPFVKVQSIWSAAKDFVDLGTQGETVSWHEHRPSIEQNEAFIATARQLTEQIRGEGERLARKLQKLYDPPGGDQRYHTRAAGWGFWDGWGGKEEHPWFVPSRQKLREMSPEELRAWWDALTPGQRELMANTMPELDLDSGVAERILTDAMREAADGNVVHVENLDVMLTLFGHDDAAMASMFTAVGGATVVGVLREAGRSGQASAAGEASSQAAFRVVTTLRENLAAASADWSETAAKQFAQEVMRGSDETAWPAPEVAYLFADELNNPMSEHFTVAMADELDAVERGNPDWPGHWPPDSYSSGLFGLLAANGMEDPERHARLNDPMGRVLSTLGQYPDAALDWLTDAAQDEFAVEQTAGEARLEHYYKVRDSSADGFEGVSAVWAGALQASGGPYDQDSWGMEADDGGWERVATMTTLATRGLEANPAFVPENVSSLGARDLATGTVLSLP